MEMQSIFKINYFFLLWVNILYDLFSSWKKQKATCTFKLIFDE